ncbi:MAG: glycosyl hydrolase family 65 protein [Candidatus Sigynarchaeum springense]
MTACSFPSGGVLSIATLDRGLSGIKRVDQVLHEWHLGVPLAAQISGSQLGISNQYCDLDFSGTYISSMRLDGTGSGSYQSEWLAGGSGYRWYRSDGVLLQPSGGTWVNVTSTIPGGTSTDGVYRLVTNLGTSIEAMITVWLNGSSITIDYSFKIMETIGIMKDGWAWVFNETLDKWSPSLVDAVWSIENGGGRFFMTMHQMMRRPFHYIWGQGSDTYWYQGKGSAGATVEFHVPPEDEAHLFLNEGNHLVITTYPWDAHVGASPWTALATTVVNRTFTIDVHPQGNIINNAPADYPRFTVDTPIQIGSGADSMNYGDALTRFFWERVYTYSAGGDGNWIDWSSSEFAWNTPRFLEETMRNIEHMPISPEGHCASWGPLDGWPFPDNDSNMWNVNYYDTRHPTTNPNYITSIWRIWQWTSNDTWLFQQRARIYKTAKFFIDMLVKPGDVGNPARVASVPGAVPLPPESEGLLLCDWRGHHGASGGIGSNYWDIQPFGWLDSYVNALAYGALLSLADFEAHWGNASGAAIYLAKAAKLRESYTKLFWDDIFGRFIGCVDAWGNRHDYGFTFINQQAAYYGLEWGAPLVDTAQVFRMYDWMENEPTGSGLKDTFTRWIYAARSNTDINHRGIINRTVEKDWWVAQGQMGDEGYRRSGPWPWAATNGQLQNGGCSVYTSYHDLMARTAFFSSDNAENRIREILNRWVLPDHICGGSPLYLGENPQQENAGSVGTDYPFPESGLVPTFVVYGFMGMVPRWKPADVGGSGLPAGHVLVLDPVLPSTWNGYSARNLQFGGTMINVSVNTTAIIIEFPMPLASDYQIEVNSTRYRVSDIVDGSGRAVLAWNARQGELQRRASAASNEYASHLASGKTINATGQQDLHPVPDILSGATLNDLFAWWQQTVHLMTAAEYAAIKAEIEALERRTDISFTWLASGNAMLPCIARQRGEAMDSLARGDLRWMLGNYRQALVIAERLERLLDDAMPGVVLQWFIVPALALVALVVVVHDAWKRWKKRGGVSS